MCFKLLNRNKKTQILRSPCDDCYTQMLHKQRLSGATTAKQTYLHKRTNSSVYYFRCRIPKDLTFHFKDRQEITFSLQTHDYHEATRPHVIRRWTLLIKHSALRASQTHHQVTINAVVFPSVLFGFSPS